ncbi:MAG TPA: hypothetical protein VM432_04110 [Bdellovibrionales bacterium]|jgi:hypothetical protein|nr:hypothetical protein [Bdellovibrionales bacterium]
MSNIRNQNGSVLLIVIIAAAVAVTLITNVMTRLNSMATMGKKDALIRENTRLGDEFAKLVVKAYESAEQLKATGLPMCTGTGVHVQFGAVEFCFPTDVSARCFQTRWSDSSGICLDVAANPPQIVAKNGIEHIEFYTTGYSQKPMNAKYRLLVPAAYAQTKEYGKPADLSGTWTPNSYAAITCDGSSGDPAICKECGGGGRFACIDIIYCPADTNPFPCSSADLIRTGIMIDL